MCSLFLHTVLMCPLVYMFFRAVRAWRATIWPTAGLVSWWWWRTATPTTTSTSPATARIASMWYRRAAAWRPSTAYHLYTGTDVLSSFSHTNQIPKSFFFIKLFWFGRNNLNKWKRLNAQGRFSKNAATIPRCRWLYLCSHTPWSRWSETIIYLRRPQFTKSSLLFFIVFSFTSHCTLILQSMI